MISYLNHNIVLITLFVDIIIMVSFPYSILSYHLLVYTYYAKRSIHVYIRTMYSPDIAYFSYSHVIFCRRVLIDMSTLTLIIETYVMCLDVVIILTDL